MASVSASEVQKSFGEWHDKAIQAPVEVTKYGRTSIVLVSAPLFRAMWESFRRAVPVSALSSSEVDLILNSEISAGEAYDLEDIPDIANEPSGLKL